MDNLTRRRFLSGGLFSLGAASLPYGPQALASTVQTAKGTTQRSAPQVAKSNILGMVQEAFFFGRQYFVLRSGRAQMILQADRADLGPAFTFLIFDAEDPAQSKRKAWALNYVPEDKRPPWPFNFVPEGGFASTALKVELGGFLFTALGQHTQTRWVSANGIPAVEAKWWAGGVRITERLMALSDDGVFQRSIELEGVDLMGNQPVMLRLSLPKGRFHARERILIRNTNACQLALVIYGSVQSLTDLASGCIDIGPITIAPKSHTVIKTGFLAQIPAGSVETIASRAGSLMASSAVSEISTTREAWTTTSQLTTQDNTVQELFDKSRYGLPGMITENGTMDTGIFEYGGQWVRDTTNTALAALYAGYFEIARGALNRVLATMVSDHGTIAVRSGHEAPPADLDELDMMGEIVHAMKAYHDWTGDVSLLRKYRDKLLALIQRSLGPQFRDETGMIHDRREFWEGTFEDAYELAYQTYLIQGLRDGAELAAVLGVEGYASRWRQAAAETLDAMLHHPARALVHEGHLIKRRNVTGEIANMVPSVKTWHLDAPRCTELYHSMNPDSSAALPIAFGIVDPESPLARKTLDQLEYLWNERWVGGGYGRYNQSREQDQPGPWPFATGFLLWAQHEARLYDRSRRTLEWLNRVQGGGSGWWYEEISLIRSQEPQCGVLPNTSVELIIFVIHHLLGIRFRQGRIVIRPNLYPEYEPVSANLRFREGRLRLTIDGGGPIKQAHVNGSSVEPASDGSLVLPSDFTSGNVAIQTRQRNP